MARGSDTMAWERRNGKGEYYTRTRKVNGRDVREYIGTGMKGALAAAADLLRRKQRQFEVQERRAQESQWQSASEPLNSLCKAADVVARAALAVAGYHQHAHSEWRRRQIDSIHEPGRKESYERHIQSTAIA